MKNKIIRIASWLINFILVKLKLEHKIFIFSKHGLIGPVLFFKVHAMAIKTIYGSAAKFCAGFISQDLTNDLLTLKSEVGTQSIEDAIKDHSGVLLVDNHDQKVLSDLDMNLEIYNLHNTDINHPTILLLHSELRKMFATHIKCPFIFVNTRMWISKPSSQLTGPNQMHTDGFEAGHQKIMIYLSPMDAEHGYLKFEDQVILNSQAGQAILFDNSEYIHAGVPGTKNDRISIEVTIMHTFISGPQVSKGHFFGRHLIDPVLAYNNRSSIQPDISNINKGVKINLGSGPCDWDDWRCFDAIDHENVTSISFSPTFTLPIQDHEVALAYSSHKLGHLPDNIIERLLSEIKRTLMPKGLFLLKIPDYDWFLDQYKYGIKQSMSNKGVEEIIYTWESWAIEDSFENRLAMMFSGYWNQEYGDHFSSKLNLSSDSYHGPPMAKKEFLKELFTSHSPKNISNILNSIVLEDKNFQAFNHQNAWSKSEMHDVLNSNGFSLITDDKELIIRKYRSFIPNLQDMDDWSSFYLCEASI